MSKLYPPYIEGKIRAQSGGELYIPFRLNRAISSSEASVMTLLLKTVSTGTTIGTYTTAMSEEDIKKGEATFTVSGLTPGQYYKAQLAFGAPNTGYYSSVGVFKYTHEIKEGKEGDIDCIYIDVLNKNTTNNHQYRYVGIYNHASDTIEKAYSYCFNIYDSNNKIVLTSGTQIHNNANDVDTKESCDIWYINQQLDEEQTYKIEYLVNTVNNLPCSSGLYTIKMRVLPDDDYVNSLHMGLRMRNNYDNGCVRLTFEPNDNIKLLTAAAGRQEYIISRCSSKDNFRLWQDIYRFGIASNTAMPREIFTDFTVEQGVKYCYALQQHGINPETNKYQISDRVWFITNQNGIWEDYVTADFEDIFLYDGERQFKVRYNPKISSFKATILETKTDTIGGPYPFIFRNGNVKYQEMNISGLVSHTADPDEMFARKREIDYSINESLRMDTAANISIDQSGITNLSTENFMAERNFKNLALSWLTNGKPKLMRTPAEGNYIVRLMNTSMTPLDSLSRMLHTFTSTAYEIAECNINNLIKYGIINDCVDTLETRMYYSSGLSDKAEYIEFTENGNYTLTYEDGTKEDLKISSVPYVFHNFGAYLSKIEPDTVLSGFMESFSESSFKIKNNSQFKEDVRIIHIGTSTDLVSEEEMRLRDSEECNRVDINNWDVKCFNRLVNDKYAKENIAEGIYQYYDGIDNEGQPKWHNLIEGKIYPIGGIDAQRWVEYVPGADIPYPIYSKLESFIRIKPHQATQATIKLPFEQYPDYEHGYSLSNIDIDYLYVGNCIIVDGSYDYKIL